MSANCRRRGEAFELVDRRKLHHLIAFVLIERLEGLGAAVLRPAVRADVRVVGLRRAERRAAARRGGRFVAAAHAVAVARGERDRAVRVAVAAVAAA